MRYKWWRIFIIYNFRIIERKLIMEPNKEMYWIKVKEERIKKNQNEYVQKFFNKKCGRKRGK